MRHLLAAVVGLALVGALATTAAASAPTVIQRNETVVRDFGGLTDCQALGYDFTFAGHFVVQRSDILYYDANGTLVKEVIKARFVGTDTNEDNGKTLTDNGSRNITFDFVNGTITESGVLRHVTVPGSGVILLEAGHLIVSLEDESVIFMAGPHQLLTGDINDFCAALADP